MEEIETIRRFLRAVRRRAALEAGLRAGSFTTAALFAALTVLSLCAVRTGPATFWPALTVGVLLVLTGVGLGVGCLVPLRRLRSDGAVARYVGQRHPPVASDLLSAVELRAEGAGPVPHGGSPSIAGAFQAAVAAAVRPLDPGRLVPLRGAAYGLAALGVTAALLMAGATWAPAVRGGLALLLRHPTRFEGAAVVQEPLIGDVRLTYTYPGYTGLPARVIEGSTGDVVALKGTRVTMETRTLRSARQALLLLGETGEVGELPAQLDGDGRLVASLTLREGGIYRVWLSPLIGRPVREARGHRIVVEADRAPEVEILGAADRLELPAPRPVEVAYSARDDFGLDTVDMVYRVDDGPEQRLPLRTGGGSRSLQGKTVFEPPPAALGPGARVAYHIEARDRDTVSGAKTGSSRTLYLIIQNPRENLDDRLARQREILDRLLATLADRLEMGQEGTPRGTSSAAGTAAQLTVWLGVHQTEESHLALLGRTIDEERRAGSASKPLLASLAGIADRLGRLMREEAALLGAVRVKVDVGAAAAAGLARLQGAGVKHSGELESAALLLDDLIGRQRLEDLAALGRELTSAHKRLQDLLARYNATRDEALRRQIERELRDLRARIQELARKIAEVKARNEVPAEWQNMPNLDDALKIAERLDALLEKGDTQSMAQALAELGKRLQDLQQALGKNADDFGNERFAPENRAATELMKKLGDLEGDQRGVADDSHGLAGEVDSEASRRLKAQSDELAARVKEKVEALRRKLGAQPPRDLGEVAEDELHRAQESVRQMRRLMPAKDWAEAKKESERASSSLRRLRRSLEERNAQRKSPAPAADAFGEEMGSAGKLAQELASDLEKLVPRPEEALSPGQRDRSHQLGERQGSLEQRAQQLAEEMSRKSNLVPGADKAGGELKEIGQQMGEAGGDLSRGAAREGAGKAQDAADRLAKMRNSMGQRQMGQGQSHREPVRIPGADESKAPREWRQELLDAMREHAPEKFREQVRRYYEELVK
jgi:HAMP domain-containing protein